MCGRFALDLVDLSELPEWLAAEHDLVVDWQPRFNIAPSLRVPILLARPERTLLAARWGLLPPFAREPAAGNRFINARVETIAKASAFRDSFRHRRCVVPATGFFEWRDGPKPRQPYFIHPSEGGILPLAGLWSTWVSKHGEAIDSFTIITTEARGVVRGLHDRMPLVLPRGDIDRWLSPDPIADGELRRIVDTGSDTALQAHEVSSRINSSKVDEPSLIVPKDEEQEPVPAQLSLYLPEEPASPPDGEEPK
jgi:putative SOS response-associated peptidase YedK